MNLTDLLIIYTLIGVACAVAVYHRSVEPPLAPRRVASAAVTVPLWPLWAPFALATGSPRRWTAAGARLPVVAQVDTLLAEALEAIDGTPAQPLLSRQDAAAISERVLAAAQRLSELQAQLRRPAFDLATAAERIAELESRGASESALTTARLHHQSLERLDQCCLREEQALAELVELLQIMRAQLLLARFGPSDRDDHPDELLAEIWARLESIGVVEISH